MNEDTLKGQWKELKGKVKQKWAKLTDDDMLKLDGSSDELSGRLQKLYGYKKDQADKEVSDFMHSHNDNRDTE